MWIYKLYNDINVYTTSCSLGNYDFQWCRTLINLDDRCERSEYSRGQYIEKEKKNNLCGSYHQDEIFQMSDNIHKNLYSNNNTRSSSAS